MRTPIEAAIHHEVPGTGGSNQLSMAAGACLMSVGHVPSTLNNFGWLRKFDGSTLLSRCLQGLRERFSWPVSVLVEKPCPEAIMLSASSAGAKVLSASGGHWLRSIGLAAEGEGTERVLLVHGLLGLDLIPASLFDKLTSSHQEAKAHLTFCHDLPAPLYAAVCEKKALDLFAGLPDGMALNEDPNAVFASLSGIAQTLQNVNELRLQKVELLEDCGLERRYVPGYIADASLSDVARIESALSNSDQTRPGESLRRLRKFLMRDWEAESRKAYWPKQAARYAPRILFASNPSAFSGSEQALVSTVRSLRRGHWDLHCLVAQEGLFSDRLQAAEATLHCPHRDFALPNVPNFLLSGAILDAVCPDILHCNAFVGVPLLAQARARGIAVLQWARLARFDGMLDHLIGADIITAVSKFVRDQVLRHMVSPAKIRVLYDCIDAEDFRPADARFRSLARQEFGLKEDEFVILCAARFAAYKRHDVLLRGFSAACAEARNLRLLLAGEAQSGGQSTVRDIRALVSNLGISDRVVFTGFVADSRRLIAVADAAVLCSDNEPLGCSVLEAMAMGLPTILSMSGGFPEMVTDGQDGLLFKAGDPDALARQILLLSSAAGLRERLGANARRTAQERFSLSAHAEALQEIYEEVLSDRQKCSTSA